MSDMEFGGLTRRGLLAATCLAMTACASAKAPTAGPAHPQQTAQHETAPNEDPLEDVNRAVFAFNDVIDRNVAEPVAKGYRNVTPEPVRKGVRNFLRNLRSPINAGNQLLQGDVTGAGIDVSRFVVNTIFGVAGIMDVAEETGLHYEPEDFGQTLGVWGVGSGPYIVLPLLGPSTVRDATGSLADAYADPVRLYLDNTDRNGVYYGLLGATYLARREEALDVTDDLRTNSLDYYTAIRSSYLQHREALIKDGNAGGYTSVAIPDYDDEPEDDASQNLRTGGLNERDR